MLFWRLSTPRATYTPDFFRTTAGVENGISGLYEALRDPWGDYLNAFGQMATDETTYADLADGNFKDPDRTVGSGFVDIKQGAGVDPAGRLWTNRGFSTINNANGIIKFGTEAGISPSLLAEANFFRAYRYFMMVITFGGAPLDLGAGELEFNSVPTKLSVRNTVPEVYTRAIFKDLKYCIEMLPDSPRLTGAVTKNVARYFLAKAYLSYAWWLENPNNIPTWPETARVDPDGHDYQWYFQQAYDLSLEAINNPGPYGLMDTFFEVHNAGNDYNKEMLFYVDHWQDTTYGGFNSGNNGSNFYYFFFSTPQYDQIYTDNGEVNDEGKPRNNYVAVTREAAQYFGRPWARQSPTVEALVNTFADKENDSRFESTFVTTFFGNWHKQGGAHAERQSVKNIHNGLTIPQGGAVLKFIPDQEPGVVTYAANANNPTDNNGQGLNNFGAGWMEGEAAYVVEYSKINRRTFPSIWKIGNQRNNNGTGLGDYNGESPRPQKLAMFSEFYFIAAEAAVKGATGAMSARDLVNVIRARAGKWIHKNSDGIYPYPNGPGNYTADRSAEMVAATPADIDIDYILMERSREYYGEGFRWWDLTRTQKWQEFAATYTLADKGNHDPKVNTRDIPTHLYLRPIPDGGQIQRMEWSDDPAEALQQQKVYQNPGYID